MTANEIHAIVEKQRAYFRSGATLDVAKRKKNLIRLKRIIRQNASAIEDALRLDLGKSGFESYMCETGLTLSELSYMISHVEKFAREKTVMTPLAQFCSRSYVKPSPYGVVLIMSPWNYPFMLSLEPLVDAIAAGNTVILKPSAYSPHTSALIEKLLSRHFDEELIAVVSGGRQENTCLLNEHFDYIFFTGSQAVGKEVMQRAAQHLTPVTLELGGKSPCIVDKSANLKLAARRIVFGKYLNCGQTCVAPDYLYVDIQVKDQLIKELKKQIVRQFGTDPMANMNYGKIINKKHFDRILSLIDQNKVVHGGGSYPETLQIEPTIMDDVTFDDAVMKEEIFGPVLPILTFNHIQEVINKVNAMPHPLALYMFSRSRANAKKVMNETSFGGGCINDTIIHLATSNMGFGGFGESGMGSYHGKCGFDTFSHKKSIVDKKQFIDLPMRYQPYKNINEILIHMFLR